MWNACYIVRFPKYGDFRTAYINDHELKEEADHYKMWLIQRIIEHVEVVSSSKYRK